MKADPPATAGGTDLLLPWPLLALARRKVLPSRAVEGMLKPHTALNQEKKYDSH